MSTDPILKFFRDCSEQYLGDIRAAVKGFPKEYVYPTGNPIRPVLPVETTTNSVMLIGAFPSARFHYIQGKLVPVADNLAPFAKEVYFDGRAIRKQASRESLEQNYFGKEQLDLRFEDMWVTDLVKVYLFPQKHIKNCDVVAPKVKFVNTHSAFEKIAVASVFWMLREIKLASPKLIITLGEVPARVLQNDLDTKTKDLLSGLQAHPLPLDKEYPVAHLAHPEIRRINKGWDEYTVERIRILRRQMEKLL